MKQITSTFAAVLLVAGPAGAEDGAPLRYRDLSGPMSLSVSQIIEIPAAPQVRAGREFSFDLGFVTESGTGASTITIQRARASYEAHGVRQRLGAHHLQGRSFSLSPGDGGRRLAGPDGDRGAVIDLDSMIAGGFSVRSALVDLLPELPEGPVAAGTTWATERAVRSLEGWGWGIGRLKSRHEIASVKSRSGRATIIVRTEAEGTLGPEDPARGFSGDLRRTLEWSFDAARGRLLSLSMEQQTEGIVSGLPQGEVRIRQRTEIELRSLPEAPEEAPVR